MYTHCNSEISRADDSIGNLLPPPDATTARPMHFSTTLQQQHYQHGLAELNSRQLNLEVSYNNNNNGYSSGGGNSNYMRSPSSNGAHYHAFSAFFAELQDDGSVRRVCSTGDLQRINGMQHYHQSNSPLSSESSMIIEGIMSRPSPYSPEEKKVRIERYRSKRNQRNFNKKIKYACRKTLADSRPRIKGRFARNDEIAINHPIEWNNVVGGRRG